MGARRRNREGLGGLEQVSFRAVEIAEVLATLECEEGFQDVVEPVGARGEGCEFGGGHEVTSQRRAHSTSH